MLCKLKLAYGGRQTLIEDKANIDFRFLEEKLGLILSKDKSRNPLVLSVSVTKDKGIWITKNSFTTTVQVKFAGQDVWKSLLVSDGFELENKAALQIDKFELTVEKVMFPGVATPVSKSEEKRGQASVPSARNLQKTSENTPMSTPNSNFNIKEQEDPMPNEETEDFWDYIDTLLTEDKQKSSQKLTPGSNQDQRKPGSRLEGSGKEVRHYSTMFPAKEAPRKADLVVEAKRDRVNLEDLENLEEIESMKERKKIKRESEVQEESKQKKSRAGPRSYEPMVVEKEEDEDKKGKERRNKENETGRNDGEQKRNNTIESMFKNMKARALKVVEVEDEEIKGDLIMASLTQEPGRKGEEQKNGGNGSAKLQRLKQIIDDKREENVKNSVKKSVGKGEIMSEQKGSKETCSICLGDGIEDPGKINVCSHVFCFECIRDWSKVTNECPLCKVRFNEIVRTSKEGVKLEVLKVKFKKQVYEEEVIDEETDDNCYECGTSDDMYLLLVCDSCGFYCCHTYCCRPQLDHIPEEDWHCKYCRQDFDLNRQQRNRRGNRGASRGSNTTSRNQTGTRRRTTRNSNRRSQTLGDDFFEEHTYRGRSSRRTEIDDDEASRSSVQSTSSNLNRRYFEERSMSMQSENSRSNGNSSRYLLRNQGKSNT